MQADDYVVLTKNREIRILPKLANGKDGIAYMEATDHLLGRITKDGDESDECWVEFSYPEYSMRTVMRLADVKHIHRFDLRHLIIQELDELKDKVLGG